MLAFAAAALLSLPGPSVGSEQEPAALLPISMADVPAQAAAENTLLDQINTFLARTPVLESIEAELAVQERVIANRLISLRATLAVASSREAISEIEQTWRDIDRVLEGWDRDLQARGGTIDRQLTQLVARSQVWRMTMELAREQEAPAEITSVVQDTAESLAAPFTARSDAGVTPAS